MDAKVEKRIRALISLLGDEDAGIVRTAREQLEACRAEAVPLIEEALNHAEAKVRIQVRALAEDWRLDDVTDEFIDWLERSQGDPDLEAGAFQLARFGPLEFDERAYREVLDRWAEEAAPTLRRKRGETLLRELNRFLFEEKRLRPDREEYEDPDNGLLNRVLDRRAGIPVTLSTIYLLLARRLELPISGIGMPGHFVLRYDQSGKEIYLDPYDRGRFLSKADCIGYLMASGFEFEGAYLFPSPNREILSRMIDHLTNVYRSRRSTAREVRLRRCRDAMG